MSPIIHHISSDEAQPKSADIVVIGGAVVSASAAVSWRGGAYRQRLSKGGMSVAKSPARVWLVPLGRTAMRVNFRALILQLASFKKRSSRSWQVPILLQRTV